MFWSGSTQQALVIRYETCLQSPTLENNPAKVILKHPVSFSVCVRLAL